MTIVRGGKEAFPRGCQQIIYILPSVLLSLLILVSLSTETLKRMGEKKGTETNTWSQFQDHYAPKK